MVKTELYCAECGEPLKVSSRHAQNNNMGEVDHVKISILPCEYCLRVERETEERKAGQSTGLLSDLSDTQLRMLKNGLGQLNYASTKSMTVQFELERKLSYELSRRKNR